MHVIGTAGHVDHGKSLLVEAMTGIHPDRLKEEREREMTIDLGFAWVTLPHGEEIGIVDVPGHRDFIENMLAGVGGIDAVLFVVAADEGIMPQTREHLAIVDLLNIQTGVIALTKIDLFDDREWIDLVEDEVHKTFLGTTLENAEVFRVSSKTKEGISELLIGLERCLENIPPREDQSKPRLPIDRVFTMSGFGTVVTGTLDNGTFSVGDEIEILPSGIKGRIRGLQTHRRQVETAHAGSRTAVNISGVNLEDIQRGQVVVKPSTYRSSNLLDVHFKLLGDASQPLKHDQHAKFFVGASETVARIRLLGVDKLNQGDDGWLQLETSQPVVVARGDRFILRRPSPGETIGGGYIVDAFPKGRYKRFSSNTIDKLVALSKGSSEEILLQGMDEIGAGTVKDIIARSGLKSQSAIILLDQLYKDNLIIRLEKERSSLDFALSLEDWLSTPTFWDSLREKVSREIKKYHQDHPLKSGIPREELRSRLKLQPRLFNIMLGNLKERDDIEETNGCIRESKFSIQFSPAQQVKINQLINKFKNAPFATPSVKECQNEVGEDEFEALLDLDILVQVSPDVVFLRDSYSHMVSEVTEQINQRGTISAGEVRDYFKTSRKYALALLEYMDKQGITIRKGDERQLKV